MAEDGGMDSAVYIITNRHAHDLKRVILFALWIFFRAVSGQSHKCDGELKQ